MEDKYTATPAVIPAGQLFYADPVPQLGMRDLVGIVFRYKRTAGLAFVATAVAALLIGLLFTKHEAEMEILVKNGRVDPIITAQPASPIQPIINGSTTVEEVNSEIQLLTSHDVLADVARDVHLDSRMTSLFDYLRSKDSLPAVRLQRAVEKLLANLDVAAVQNSNIITIKYKGRYGNESMAVLSALRDRYLRKHLEVHRVPGQSEFFGSQARYYQALLADTEEKLASFNAGQTAVSPLGELPLKEQSMATFESQVKAASANVEQMEKRITQLESELQNTDDWRLTETHTVASTQVAAIRASLLDLQFKRTDLLTRYAPTNPLVGEIDAKIEAASAALQEAETHPPQDQIRARDSAKEWTRGELVKARADLRSFAGLRDSLAQSLREYHDEARFLNAKSYEQGDLLRKEKVEQENFLLYTQKREEARITEALDETRIANLAVAEPPCENQSFPFKRPVLFTMVSILLGCIVSATFIAAAEMLDNTVRTPDELALHAGVPVLAAIPAKEELKRLC
jgi:uncharacterized protein involved in exopolysaccharide biosynthesis